MELKSTAHKVGINVHHFEWCTKYRYEMLGKGEYKKFCEDAVRQQAEKHHITIRELFAMLEHVHVSCELPPNMSQSQGSAASQGRIKLLAFEITVKVPAALPARPFLEPRRICGQHRTQHGGHRGCVCQEPARHPPAKPLRLRGKPRTLVRGGGHQKN